VGKRMNIHHTRAMLNAALEGCLNDVPFHPDPVFGLFVPETVPGVPMEVLNPRNTWADKAAYDAQARDLARRFVENFERYRAEVTPDVIEAAPRI
jgi:phosphoenolpyruvate carboxykinase (ATP)